MKPDFLNIKSKVKILIQKHVLQVFITGGDSSVYQITID